MARAARRFIIEGRVQGVFFRDSTRRFAEPLGICGHAINLPDGNVEVRACGEADAIAMLRGWLADGPPLADVSGVSEQTIEPFESGGFRTG
ncbi:MAG: acylphosphatase [Woeseiaceae bacterium]|nr:acylphosphatase [Woeseiaceae bacterium]